MAKGLSCLHCMQALDNYVSSGPIAHILIFYTFVLKYILFWIKEQHVCWVSDGYTN